jgi:hypothetical protein
VADAPNCGLRIADCGLKKDIQREVVAAAFQSPIPNSQSPIPNPQSAIQCH